jgi:hypothetical protein
MTNVVRRAVLSPRLPPGTLLFSDCFVLRPLPPTHAFDDDDAHRKTGLTASGRTHRSAQPSPVPRWSIDRDRHFIIKRATVKTRNAPKTHVPHRPTRKQRRLFFLFSAIGRERSPLLIFQKKSQNDQKRRTDAERETTEPQAEQQTSASTKQRNTLIDESECKK